MQNETKSLNVARAVVDGVSTPPVYLSHNGGFTDAGLSRPSAGTYRLTLSRPMNTNRAQVKITPVAPSAAGRVGTMGYSWISSTVIEVEVYNSASVVGGNADFSIEINQVL